MHKQNLSPIMLGIAITINSAIVAIKPELEKTQQQRNASNKNSNRYAPYLEDLILPAEQEKLILVLEDKTKKEQYKNQPSTKIPRFAKGPFPVRFRTMHDVFMPIPEKYKSFLHEPSAEGLEHLHAAGSAQFCQKTIRNIFDEIKLKYKNIRQIAVIDLRRETHGFINGQSFVLFAQQDKENLGKTTSEILEDEAKEFAEFPKHARAHKKVKSRMVHDDNIKKILRETDQPIAINTITSEKKLIEKLGGLYFRLPIRSHHRPNDQVIDEFINIVKKLPKNTFIYFHCAAGKGRTTTMLILLDMMKNAKKVSYNDIVTRQFLLGGSLFHPEKKSKSEYKQKANDDRLIFLKNFYEYCRSNNDNFSTSWSSWLEKQLKTSIALPLQSPDHPAHHA